VGEIKKKRILNDRVFYFLSTAIVILIVIVIELIIMIRRMRFPDKTFSNFNHSPKAINSLITQSACVYLDLFPHVKWMLTEIYAGNQYFIQEFSRSQLFIYKTERLKRYFL
jgi:hypothetical protein